MLTMSDRLLDIGENLLISFPNEKVEVKKTVSQGKGNAVERVVKAYTSRIFLFKVGAWYPFFYEWDQIGALAAAGSSGLDYLGSSGHGSGDDILRIAEDDFHVYHFALVPSNPNVRIYKTISPIGDVLSALDRKKSSDLASVSSGSKFDHYTGRMISNNFDPDIVAENVVFRAASNDDGQYFQWGFYAINSIPAGSPFFLIGRGYKLIPVVDEKEQQEMLKESMTPIDKRKTRTTSVTVGGIYNTDFSVSSFLPNDWDNIGNYVVYEGI